jgi:hypothetical protein
MSYYGTKSLENDTILEKRRFGPGNTLRFGNVNFLLAYDPTTLANIEVTQDSTTSVVSSGLTDCVTVAIGPYTPSLVDFKSVNLTESMTLDPGLNCIVLEGIVSDETGNVFDSNKLIPHFVTLNDPVILTVTQPAKLLIFKAV